MGDKMTQPRLSPSRSRDFSLNQKRRLSGPAIGVIVVGALLALYLFAGFMSNATTSNSKNGAATASVAAASADVAPGLTSEQAADKFVAFPGGLAVRWATPAEKQEVPCPAYATSCNWVAIQANEPCPSGIYIELQLKNANGLIVGKANEITPGMGVGDKGVFPVSSTQRSVVGFVSDVHCMG